MKICQLKQLEETVLGRRKTRKYLSSKQNILKKLSNKENKPTSLPKILTFELFSTNSLNQSKIMLQRLYSSLEYCRKKLIKPKIDILAPKFVKLPQTNKKLLFIDLDETLIHTQTYIQSFQSSTLNPKNQVSFYVRPYTFQFLKNMSKLYDIYIFTASTKEYCLPIVSFLNRQFKTIKGILHRKNCLRTSCGYFIKDLRIIENHRLDQMVLVDNTPHSFAFQIENGIPVQSFFGQKNDKVLQNLESLLRTIEKAQNTTSIISQKLQLSELTKYPLNSYLSLMTAQQKVDKTIL